MNLDAMVTRLQQHNGELLVPSPPWKILIYRKDMDALPGLAFSLP